MTRHCPPIYVCQDPLLSISSNATHGACLPAISSASFDMQTWWFADRTVGGQLQTPNTTNSEAMTAPPSDTE